MRMTLAELEQRHIPIPENCTDEALQEILKTRSTVYWGLLLSENEFEGCSSVEDLHQKLFPILSLEPYIAKVEADKKEYALTLYSQEDTKNQPPILAAKVIDEETESTYATPYIPNDERTAFLNALYDKRSEIATQIVELLERAENFKNAYRNIAFPSKKRPLLYRILNALHQLWTEICIRCNLR